MVQGIQIAILGFAVVVIALIVLYLVMLGFGKVINPQDKKPEQKDDQTSAKTEAASPAKTETQKTPVSADGDVDPKVVAAISAAVSFVMSGAKEGFYIRSIRPVDREDPSWRLLGRKRQLEATPLKRK